MGTVRASVFSHPRRQPRSSDRCSRRKLALAGIVLVTATVSTIHDDNGNPGTPPVNPSSLDLVLNPGPGCYFGIAELATKGRAAWRRQDRLHGDPGDGLGACRLEHSLAALESKGDRVHLVSNRGVVLALDARRPASELAFIPDAAVVKVAAEK